MHGPDGQHDQERSTPAFLRDVARSVFGGSESPPPPAPEGATDASRAQDESGDGGEGLSEVWESWSRMVEGEPADQEAERGEGFELDLHAVGERSTAEQVAVEPAPEPEDRPAEDGTGQERGDLEHPSPQVRVAALRRLREDPHGAPVVAVTARLQDPDPQARVAAVEVLEALGDDEVLLVTLGSLADPAEEVRTAVREAFHRRHSPELVGLLGRKLSAPGEARAVAGLLAEMGEIAALIEAAGTGDPDTRRVVIEALESSGTIRELIGALEDRRPEQRIAACEQLGSLGALEAVGALAGRLADPEPSVRVKASEALAAVGERSALPALKRAYVWDPDSGVVAAVGDAIRRISGSPADRSIDL